MPKAIKKRVCIRCNQEKLQAQDFGKNNQTCKACLGTGIDRLCAGCRQHLPSASFPPGKARCRNCQFHKDTADHVDQCNCGTAFSRDPDTFTWRSRQGKPGNWDSKCKECCAFKEYTEPHRCTKCDVVKDPAEFNRPGECKSCRSERTARERMANVAAADPATTAGKPCTQCNEPFSAETFRWQRDRWSSHCKACYNGARYWEKTRQHKIADDPEAYRSAQAAYGAQYRQRRRAEVDTSWANFTAQARQNGRTWAQEQEAELRQLLLEPCHYCAYLPESGHPLNHLDRVDNTKQHYSLESVVTCCTPCNRIKGRWLLADFLSKAGEEAARGQCPSADRGTIDAAYRSFSSRDKDARAQHSFYHEHMCYVAAHNGYEF